MLLQAYNDSQGVPILPYGLAWLMDPVEKRLRGKSSLPRAGPHCDKICTIKPHAEHLVDRAWRLLQQAYNDWQGLPILPYGLAWPMDLVEERLHNKSSLPSHHKADKKALHSQRLSVTLTALDCCCRRTMIRRECLSCPTAWLGSWTWSKSAYATRAVCPCSWFLP